MWFSGIWVHFFSILHFFQKNSTNKLHKWVFAAAFMPEPKQKKLKLKASSANDFWQEDVIKMLKGDGGEPFPRAKTDKDGKKSYVSMHICKCPKSGCPKVCHREDKSGHSNPHSHLKMCFGSKERGGIQPPQGSIPVSSCQSGFPRRIGTRKLKS